MKSNWIFLLAVTVLSCQSEKKESSPEKNKAEIMEAEKAFAAMASEKGIAEAFWFYADSNATIRRQNDSLIHGKEGIKNFYSTDFYKRATVKWLPDFIDVSTDGNLGYTYGKYVWTSKDSSGKPIEFKGIFHTVWKKQKDGEWRYVWD